MLTGSAHHIELDGMACVVEELGRVDGGVRGPPPHLVALALRTGHVRQRVLHKRRHQHLHKLLHWIARALL